MNLENPGFFLPSRLDFLFLSLNLIPSVRSLSFNDRDITFFTHTNPLADRGHGSSFGECLEGQPIETSVCEPVAII